MKNDNDLDEIQQEERIAAAVKAGHRLLSECDSSLLVRLIEERLQENRHAVESQYERLASHYLKWVAVPSKRSSSWIETVVDAKSNLMRYIEDGGALAAYVRGTGSISGHTLSPETIYRRALEKAVGEYLPAHPKVSRHVATALFSAAVPTAPPLAFWLSVELPADGLPSWHSRYLRR